MLTTRFSVPRFARHDAVTIKVLLGLRLKAIINTQARRFPGKTANEAAV
jgi:hypothetical protein